MHKKEFVDIAMKNQNRITSGRGSDFTEGV